MTESIQLATLAIQVADLIVWDILKTPGVLPALMAIWFALALAPAVIESIFPPKN